MIFCCKVGDNVSESEAIHCGASFKSLKCYIRSLEDVLSNKYLVAGTTHSTAMAEAIMIVTYAHHIFSYSLKPALVMYYSTLIGYCW